jgi:hypothetical protein
MTMMTTIAMTIASEALVDAADPIVVRRWHAARKQDAALAVVRKVVRRCAAREMTMMVTAEDRAASAAGQDSAARRSSAGCPAASAADRKAPDGCQALADLPRLAECPLADRPAPGRAPGDATGIWMNASAIWNAGWRTSKASCERFVSAAGPVAIAADRVGIEAVRRQASADRKPASPKTVAPRADLGRKLVSPSGALKAGVRKVASRKVVPLPKADDLRAVVPKVAVRKAAARAVLDSPAAHLVGRGLVDVPADFRAGPLEDRAVTMDLRPNVAATIEPTCRSRRRPIRRK